MLQDVVVRETPKSKPKVIGKYNDTNNTFESVRDYTKHLLRNKNAWSIDYKLLMEFLLPKNSFINIIDNKRKVVYKTNATTFKDKGEEIEYLDHRKQICLNLDLFDKERF